MATDFHRIMYGEPRKQIGDEIPADFNQALTALSQTLGISRPRILITGLSQIPEFRQALAKIRAERTRRHEGDDKEEIGRDAEQAT